MINFVALHRLFLANRLIRNLFVCGVVYGLYLVYVSVNYAIVPNGINDPIYRFTDIPRIDQIAGVSVVFGIVVMTMLALPLARDGRPLDFARSVAMKRGTILLVVLIFLNGVASSFAAVLSELNGQFWAPLFAWVTAVMALQALIIYAALSRLGLPLTHVVLMAAVSVFNIFALYLSLLGVFLGLPEVLQAAIIALAFMSFGVLFTAVGKIVVPMRGVNAVLVLTMIGPIAATVLPSSDGRAIANRLAPFGDIEFRTKPNIHIVSIDALSPLTLAQKHLGLSDLAYARMLDGDGVVVFRNAFASHVSTKPSLNSLMRLAHTDFAGEFGYFAGRTDGPVTHVFHSNGYRISTGFDTMFFGGKGPFVDSYLPEPTRAVGNSTLCALASGSSLKFFGFCIVGGLIAGPDANEPWPEIVTNIVQRTVSESDATPVFTLHYIVDPIGHTDVDYRSSNRDALERYTTVYRNGAARVATLMERLQETVRSDGAPSILIVMGDHGPFLSRTISIKNDPTFVVQEQHGILAAVLVNETGCTAKQLQHYSATFSTPARILAGVMRCLARDPARMDSAMKFDEAYEFEDFLYEREP